jgi:hypothetical protein
MGREELLFHFANLDREALVLSRTNIVKARPSNYPPNGGSGARRGSMRSDRGYTGERRATRDRMLACKHSHATKVLARLYRKGPCKEAKLCFMRHALMENRNGLLVDACLTRADGHAERIAALHFVNELRSYAGIWVTA